jgi:hypothetical protein
VSGYHRAPCTPRSRLARQNESGFEDLIRATSDIESDRRTPNLRNTLWYGPDYEPALSVSRILASIATTQGGPGLWAALLAGRRLAAAGKVEDGLNDGICRAGYELTEDIDVDAVLGGDYWQNEENADHNQHAIRRQPGGESGERRSDKARAIVVSRLLTPGD